MNVELKLYMQSLAQLFAVFFKLGPSTFGGGYTMLTAIEREVVENRKWMDASEMADMISVAGSAPGGVAVNAATFVGYRLKGIPGAIAAVLGITFPTFVIVCCLSILGMMFRDIPKVEAAFKGIHAAIIALILVAAYRMAKASILDIATLTIAGISVVLLLFTSIHSLVLIIGGMAAGMTIISVKRILGWSIRTEKSPRLNGQEAHDPEYYI